MNDGWPGKWQSGREKQLANDGTSFTNDHGTVYMVGNMDDDEWLWFESDKPAHELRP